jgi:hypothetical protein
MFARYVGVAVGMIFAWQSCLSAQAACQPVSGATCGGTKGSISTVSGDVSVSRGGGITPAIAGSNVFAGERLLAGEGGIAQVNLGAGCFMTVAPHSIATVTSRNGMLCWDNRNDGFTAQTQPPNNDNSNWAGAGIVVLIGGLSALAFTSGLSP